MKKIRNLNQGQTLLEALIALAAIVIVLTATSVVVITSISNSTFTKQQNQANKLAQSGSEYIRDQILNNSRFPTYFGYGSPVSTTKCLDSTSTLQNRTCDPVTYSADLINGVFKREVTFSSAVCNSTSSSDFPNGLSIKVDVYWKSGKCPATGANSFCHKQEVRSCFIDPAKVVPTTSL